MKFVKLLSVFIGALLFVHSSKAQIGSWAGQGTGTLYYSWGDSTGGSVVLNGSGGSFLSKDCSGPKITFIHGYSSGMTVQTNFGDGSPVVTSALLPNGNSLGHAITTHVYQAPGTYTVTQILFLNSVPQDTIQFNYTQLYCTTMSVAFYKDEDNNCNYSTINDNEIFWPLLVKIDSSGIPIDTISCINKLVYSALGPAGTVYSFKSLNTPGSITATCPVSASINDTSQMGVRPTKYIGYSCLTGNSFDLGLTISSEAGVHALQSNIYITNTYCLPTNAVLTMNYNTAYNFFHASMLPVSQGNGTATWNLNGLADDANAHISIHLDGAQWPTGIPVSTTYSITPTIGDVVPGNNNIIIIDTVSGSFDPNAIYVKPEGCVPAGTELEYTITFENMGNGPAENIFVLDTIPVGLDAGSMRLQFASHNMSVEKIYEGNQVIFKYNFPNIMLPDSTSPDRHGMLKYKIKTNNNLSFGTNMYHRAGIYFDYNPPVLTNTSHTAICWPQEVSNVSSQSGKVSVFPNPATDELTIEADESFASYTITNNLGQVMMNGKIEKKTVQNIKSLPAGMYYISLQGKSGTAAEKFLKL